MKPNLVLIQPAKRSADPIVDRFCEAMCHTHYVYLVRPIDSFREDSPAGVRFLNYSPDRFPGFGDLESVIVVDGAEIADRLKAQYPGARHTPWDPETDQNFPADFNPFDRTIVQGEFGRSKQADLAKAM